MSTPGQSQDRAYWDRLNQRRDLQDLLTEVSSLPRIRGCMRTPVAGGVAIKTTHRPDGCIAHLAGVATCASVWACPMCAPKIRAVRATELETGALSWIEAGNSLAHAVLTVRHWDFQRLPQLLDQVQEAWRRVQSGRWWADFKRRHGLFGVTTARETPHGDNGWHPHLHLLLWFIGQLADTQADAERARRVEAELFARWVKICERMGLGRPTRKHGVKVDPVRRGKQGAADIARYVAKILDKDTERAWSMGAEMTRGDLKDDGRSELRSPFKILSDFAATGDARDLALWQEYEQATHGRRMLTWSRGLRERLRELAPQAVDERSDEEIVAEHVGGETLAVVTNQAWHRRVARVRGRVPALLAAAEAGGQPGVVALLAGWGLVWGRDVLPPPEQAAQDAAWNNRTS